MKHKSNKRFLALFLFLPLFGKATPDISLEIYRYQTDASSYIEVSLYVVGSTLHCDSMKLGEYGITYMVMVRNEQREVVAGNRYRLTAIGCPPKDIMDVKRFSIPPGKYTVELEAVDVSDTLGTVSMEVPVEIPADAAAWFLSDLQLASIVKAEQPAFPELNKSGLYLEPLPFRFYYPALQTLYLYYESYHTDQLAGQPYIQYTVSPAVGNIPNPIVGYKKLKPQPKAANIIQLDITELISGPYRLEMKLFDGNREVRASREIAFSRLNPKGDSLFMETAASQAEDAFVSTIPEDSLEYVMRAMAPIVNSLDVEVMNMLLDKGSAKAKRYFIHRYWTNQAGNLAEVAYKGYMKVALVVDENFRSGFGYGFETDRGHIFLKYGKPDDVIEVEDEPSAPPYEIWFYTTFPATHQNNVRFLFYNPSLAKNAYKLLHSTAIGEIRNDRWEIELYRDATLETPGVNAKEMGENVHRNARRYFEN